MKLAIIGCRNCPPVDVATYIDCNPDAIVSGGARGVDTYAKQYAIEHNIPLVEYLPEYAKYGRGAPLIRNKLIVENSDSLLAFWDGKSTGTKYCIDYARKLGKPIKVIII